MATDLAAEPAPNGPADADEEAEAGASDWPAGAADEAPAAAPEPTPDDVPRDDVLRDNPAREDVPRGDVSREDVRRDDAAGGDALAGDDVVERPSDATASSLFETEVPPAEPAHARRTMIGRSAEEVDHAPPRGRYAPVPAPETASTVATLRWAAPAAAAVLASAVVVGRVLRRRR